MYQHLYSRFLAANPGQQHFACHSHYFWPDVTRDAQLQYWDDSAQYVDEKWGYFFENCVPQVQQRIADVLNVPDPQQIAFAPNTHEILFRLMSCFDWRRPVRVVTTDSEFHSFSRQIARMEESGQVIVDRIATEPFSSFQQRFEAALQSNQYDLVFFSQVFFNSGVAVEDLDAIVDCVESSETMIVVDGYHGFMAKPTDLSSISKRVFYLAGSYKYAQGGEGACFVVVPPETQLRPIYTGWYAEFGALSEAKTGEVRYSKNGMRFAGATMDFSALYRLRAVLEMLDCEGLSVAKIDAYIRDCQAKFLQKLEQQGHPILNVGALLQLSPKHHGHFLTFKLPSAEVTAQLSKHLRDNGVLTDYRGDRLRFGFALYHNPDDYDLSCLTAAI